MQQTRLIRLLATLSGSEFRRFEEFLRSPYFNQSDNVITLMDLLRPHHPGFTSPALEADRICSRIFGQERDSLQPLHDLTSHATRLLEQFWSVESFRKSESEQQFHLCESLMQPDRHWYFDKQWQKAQQSTDEQGQSPSGWLAGFRMWEQGLRITQLDKRRLGEGELDHRLIQSQEHLDRFFLVQKLQLSCESLNRARIVNTTYEPELLPEIGEYLRRTDAKGASEPLIRLYGNVLAMLRDDTDEAFEELMQDLKAHHGSLDKATGLALYSYAQNYCIRQINRGRQAFLEKLFVLYKQLLNNHLILESHGGLAHWHYKNITTVALRLKEYHWTQKFLEDFRDLLDEDIRESVYHYNLAALHYELQDFKSALRLLQQTTFTDVHYDLSARSMILKIYYELEDDDALFYAIQAFEVFLRRNQQISREHVTIHRNLIRFVKKVARLRNRMPYLNKNEQQNRLKKLSLEISENMSIANKKWLLDTVQQIREEATVISPAS